MSLPEMAPLNPEPFGGGYSRPYRFDLYPPEPVRRRHLVSSKDDLYINQDGTETRVPVEERPLTRVTRVTTFGIEVSDQSAPAPALTPSTSPAPRRRTRRTP